MWDLWIKSCKETNTNIYKLEDGLYMTKKPYIINHREYWTSPMYHIWINNKHKVTNNYQEAYGIWNNHFSARE